MVFGFFGKGHVYEVDLPVHAGLKPLHLASGKCGSLDAGGCVSCGKVEEVLVSCCQSCLSEDCNDMWFWTKVKRSWA